MLTRPLAKRARWCARDVLNRRADYLGFFDEACPGVQSRVGNLSRKLLFSLLARELLPAHRSAERNPNRLGLLGLGQRPRPAQDITGADVPLLGERANSDRGDVPLVD